MLLGNRWRVARASLPMTASLTPAECFDHLVLGCGANDRALPRRSPWLDNRTNGRVLDPFQLFLKRLRNPEVVWSRPSGDYYWEVGFWEMGH